MKFINKLITVFKWIPVIWEDEQYDYWFFLKIMDYKLKLMEEYYLSEKAMWVLAKKESKRIHKVRLAIKRILEDDYLENVFCGHNKKWGVPKFKDTESESGRFSIEIIRENVKTELDKEKEGKEFLYLCEKENQLKKQDLDYVFTKLRKHLTSWWD